MFVFLKIPTAQQVDERTSVYSHIECDVEGCGEKSPPATVLLKSHGLQGLGWYCKGGHHRCPKHAEDETPLRDPQYREQE